MLSISCHAPLWNSTEEWKSVSINISVLGNRQLYALETKFTFVFMSNCTPPGSFPPVIVTETMKTSEVYAMDATRLICNVTSFSPVKLEWFMNQRVS
jgi:hypothetical protein